MAGSYQLSLQDLEVIGFIFDRMEAGQWAVDVYQAAARTFPAWAGDFDVVFDAWCGVPTYADVE